MNRPADESLKNTDNTINQTKTEKAEIVQKITSSEMASILAVWGAAIVGVINIITAESPDQFSLFSGRLLSQQYVQDILYVCLLVATLFFAFTIYIHLNIAIYEKSISFIEKIKLKIVKLIVMVYQWHIPPICIIVLVIWFFKSIIALCIILTFTSISFYFLFSSRLSITAKLALLPAEALLLTAFIITPMTSKNNQTYIIKTTVDDVREVTITGAEARGQFARITTTDGKTLLINTSAITSIQPTTSSPQKTPSPLSTATPK